MLPFDSRRRRGCGRVGMRLLCVCGTVIAGAIAGAAAEPDSAMRERIEEQGREIEELKARVEAHERDIAEMRDDPVEMRPRILDGVRIGGQGAVAFFHTGSRGQFPNAEFRIDEARLFIEARVWRNFFAYSELNLVTREDPDETFELGELYVDIENVSGLWGADDLVNLRLGRFYIPFGEEYLVRDPVNNPLISHSLSDIWGVDEGMMAFGRMGRFSYAVAVQNGGHPALRDYHADKSVAGRVAYAPASWFSSSFSAMRTGKLDAAREGDYLSEVWFGDGFIRALDRDTTSTFEAEILELDAAGRWETGHLKVAAGVLFYSDDDTEAANERDARYYYVEGKQALAGKLYGASRLSRIYAPDGFLLVGHGNRGTYFFSDDAPLTKNLWRLSVGLGYEFSPDIVAKIEYTREDGRLVDGTRRRDHDFFGLQLGFRF